MLFHDNRNVRSWARKRLFLESAPRSEDFQELFKRLLEVLDAPEQAEKHANAIRALAAGGSHLNRSEASALKKGVIDRLIVILREGDESLLGPSLYALERILGNRYSRFMENLGTDSSIPEERRRLLGDPLFIDEILAQERRE